MEFICSVEAEFFQVSYFLQFSLNLGDDGGKKKKKQRKLSREIRNKTYLLLGTEQKVQAKEKKPVGDDSVDENINPFG